jgi:hypothetical protein
MRKIEFLPCIPTRGTRVPAGPDWLHEIKHDGYRLIVQREGKRVRLFTKERTQQRGHAPDRSLCVPLLTPLRRITGAMPLLDGFAPGALSRPCGRWVVTVT